MTAPLRVGSLFTGYGGLDHAVRQVVGGELAWVSDNHQSVVKLLAHRYPGVPNLGDITAIDWATVEPVDVLAGGFPCTDVSLAGRGAGLKPGTRSGLWSHMAAAISVLRPSLVVIENVRGLCSAPAHSDLEPCPWCVGDDEGVPLRAFGAVLGDLADLGYDAVWCGLRAADVGAPHGRYRVFIVAVPSVARGFAPNPAGNGRDEGRAEPARVVGGSDAPLGGVAVGDATVFGRDDSPAAPRSGEPARSPGGPGVTAAYADSGGQPRLAERDSWSHGGRQGEQRLDADGHLLDWAEYAPAIHRWEAILGRPAPAPTEPGRRGRPVLSPRFVEWLMGADEGWVTEVPGLSRSDMLRLLGNGVVRQQGAVAVSYLLDLLATGGAA